MSQKDTLIGWLKDAHGMEKALIPVLENHANDAKDSPDVQARIQQHIEETRRHADLVHEAIVSLGSDTSGLKEIVGSVTGAVHSVSTGIFADEPVKNALSDYAAEQFEIACYISLIAAAESLGETQVASTCRQILEEDQAMAQWLQDHIPQITQSFLAQEAAVAA